MAINYPKIDVFIFLIFLSNICNLNEFSFHLQTLHSKQNKNPNEIIDDSQFIQNKSRHFDEKKSDST